MPGKELVPERWWLLASERNASLGVMRPYTLPLKPPNDALTRHRSPGPIPGGRVRVEALSSTKEKAVKSRSQHKSGTFFSLQNC